MNCKPGDMAIIIRGLKRQSPQIGKIVKVLKPAGSHAQLGPIWIIEMSRPIEVFAIRKNLEVIGSVGLSTNCHCPDAWLRPIRPDAQDLDTDVEVVTSCPRVLEPA